MSTDWQRTAESDPDHAARVRAIAHGIPARYADDQPTAEDLYEDDQERRREMAADIRRER
jgi:glutamine synthetase